MIDTQTKRRAVLGVLPAGDSNIDAGDRRQLLRDYPFSVVYAPAHISASRTWGLRREPRGITLVTRPRAWTRRADCRAWKVES